MQSVGSLLFRNHSIVQVFPQSGLQVYYQRPTSIKAELRYNSVASGITVVNIKEKSMTSQSILNFYKIKTLCNTGEYDPLYETIKHNLVLELDQTI